MIPNNLLLLKCAHSIGKSLGLVNKISIKDLLSNPTCKYVNDEQISMTYQEYGELKLMDALKNITYDNGTIPSDILKIIISYSNGQIHKCNSCYSQLVLYNVTNDRYFDKHELEQKGYHLLKDDKTIVCNSCCYFNGNLCRRCGRISHDLFGFKLGLCDNCDFGVTIQMAIVGAHGYGYWH